MVKETQFKGRFGASGVDGFKEPLLSLVIVARSYVILVEYSKFEHCLANIVLCGFLEVLYGLVEVLEHRRVVEQAQVKLCVGVIGVGGLEEILFSVSVLH